MNTRIASDNTETLRLITSIARGDVVKGTACEKKDFVSQVSCTPARVPSKLRDIKGGAEWKSLEKSDISISSLLLSVKFIEIEALRLHGRNIEKFPVATQVFRYRTIFCLDSPFCDQLGQAMLKATKPQWSKIEF